MKEAQPQGEVQCGYRRVAAGEKAGLVRGHFDQVAARYDLANTVLSLGLHHRWKRLAVDLLGLKAGERVIDVCGGTGDLAILAAKQAGEVVVYDFSRSMAEVGRGKVRRLGLTQRVRFVLGDAEAISFKKASFDAALVGFGIRNLTHPEWGLQEMHRVLKPGGRLMVLEFSQPHPAWFRRLYDLYSFSLMPLVGKVLAGSWQAYRYLPESIRLFATPEELRRTLEDAGFSRVTYRALTKGIAVIHLGVKAR